MNVSTRWCASLVALTLSTLLVAAVAACNSTSGNGDSDTNRSEAGNATADNNTAAANNDDDPVVTVPVNNADTTPTGVPSESTPFEYDDFPKDADSLYTGMAEVMQFRELRTMHAPAVQLQTPREVYESVDAGMNDWIRESIAKGHRDDYLRQKGDTLSYTARKLITNPPVFGKITEEEFRDELTRMIFASQTDAFDPETSAELGRYQTADAVLFTRVTASFKAIRQVGMMTRGKYWVRGMYKFEARLVLTEEATTVWTNAVEWQKWFVVSRY